MPSTTTNVGTNAQNDKASIVVMRRFILSVDLLSVGTWSKYVIFDFYTIPTSLPLPLKFALVDISSVYLEQ